LISCLAASEPGVFGEYRKMYCVVISPEMFWMDLNRDVRIAAV